MGVVGIDRACPMANGKPNNRTFAGFRAFGGNVNEAGGGGLPQGPFGIPICCRVSVNMSP
jgi:hypothetical protein